MSTAPYRHATTILPFLLRRLRLVGSLSVSCFSLSTTRRARRKERRSRRTHLRTPLVDTRTRADIPPERRDPRPAKPPDHPVRGPYAFARQHRLWAGTIRRLQTGATERQKKKGGISNPTEHGGQRGKGYPT